MIVPMKKIHLIVQKKDVDLTLDRLRNLGMVHVEHQKPLTNIRISELRDQVNMLKNVVEALKLQKVDQASQDNLPDWKPKADEITKLLNNIDRLTESTLKRQLQINDWEAWGNFDPDDIRHLKSLGTFIQFYRIPAKEKMEIPAGVIMETIFTAKKGSSLYGRIKRKYDFRV